LRVCCCPAWRQCGRGNVVEVLGYCLKEPTARTLYRARGNRCKDIDAAPAINIVRRSRVAAEGGSNMNCRIIQCRAARRDAVPQLWLGTPKQRYSTSDVRSRHGCTAKADVSAIGGVITGTSACSGRSDIGLDSITSVDCHRAAAAKGSDRVGAGLQSADGVRCCVDGWGIHHGRAARTVIASTRHHHYPGSGLSFDSSLQRVSRTTF
jgi:hypothetical protein